MIDIPFCISLLLVLLLLVVLLFYKYFNISTMVKTIVAQTSTIEDSRIYFMSLFPLCLLKISMSCSGKRTCYFEGENDI